MFLAVLALGQVVLLTRDEMHVMAHARDELCLPVTWWATSLRPSTAHALKETRRLRA